MLVLELYIAYVWLLFKIINAEDSNTKTDVYVCKTNF